MGDQSGQVGLVGQVGLGGQVGQSGWGGQVVELLRVNIVGDLDYMHSENVLFTIMV